MNERTYVEKEIRCPEGPRRLFLKLLLADTPDPIRVVDGNLMEMACADCRKRLQRESRRKVVQVMHYYDIGGECIETKVVERDPARPSSE